MNQPRTIHERAVIAFGSADRMETAMSRCADLLQKFVEFNSCKGSFRSVILGLVRLGMSVQEMRSVFPPDVWKEFEIMETEILSKQLEASGSRPVQAEDYNNPGCTNCKRLKSDFEHLLHKQHAAAEKAESLQGIIGRLCEGCSGYSISEGGECVECHYKALQNEAAALSESSE